MVSFDLGVLGSPAPDQVQPQQRKAPRYPSRTEQIRTLGKDHDHLTTTKAYQKEGDNEGQGRQGHRQSGVKGGRTPPLRSPTVSESERKWPSKWREGTTERGEQLRMGGLRPVPPPSPASLSLQIRCMPWTRWSFPSFPFGADRFLSVLSTLL